MTKKRESISQVMPGNHQDLMDFLTHCERAQVTPMIWGASGIGKTDVVHQWAKNKARQLGRELMIWHRLPYETKVKLYEDAEERKKAYILYDNRAASNDATDDKGIPNISNPQYLNWIQNLIYKIYEKEDAAGLLFNDEMTLAPTSVQNALYKMVYDRAVGDVSFNDGVFVVCAGNRMQDRAFVQETPFPLLTRMIHFWLIEAGPADQISHFLKIGVDHRLVAFFQMHQNLMYHYDEDSDEFTASTPRTIELCSDLIKPLEYPKQDKMIELLACGSLSTYVGSMFLKFMKHTSTLNLNDYLKDPDKVRQLTDLDNKYGLITLIVHRWGRPGAEGDIFTPAMAIFDNLDPETGILMLRMMKEKQPDKFKTGLKGNAKAVQALQKIAPIVLQ